MPPIEIQSMQYGQRGPNVLLRAPPIYMTLSEERREHILALCGMHRGYNCSLHTLLLSKLFKHVFNSSEGRAGLDVGLDSGETEKATLTGLGCGMGVERLPGVCTVSSKFSSGTKEKSFRWSGRGRGGLNVCSLERTESFQVSQLRVFQGQRLLSIQGDPEFFVSPILWLVTRGLLNKRMFSKPLPSGLLTRVSFLVHKVICPAVLQVPV